MGRRYYCDYCEINFIDDLDARKKHLQSLHHIKLRNLHYESCRDPETILREELLKIPCRRFAQYGTCQFEGNCKYTHYSPEDLCYLRQQVEEMQDKRRKKLEELPEVPSIESWLQCHYEKHKEASDIVTPFWTYHSSLESRNDLPPSLAKFKQEHFVDVNFEEWGK
ncbi:unnamed protein product [Callosobruchus maculatus]|uniref:C3H1-type domain-containing protein n=1 Tax=Callosobruchus maculatus TaxID=64391 RepID=A0A653BNA7_CALMS|nr:unnamed protein product [Callosobruchus maculatus]